MLDARRGLAFCGEMSTEVAQIGFEWNIIDRVTLSLLQYIFGDGDAEDTGRKTMLLLAGDLTTVASRTVVIVYK
jgi:hypothetical protein